MALTITSAKFGANLGGIFSAVRMNMAREQRKGAQESAVFMRSTVESVIRSSSPSGVVTSAGFRRSAPGQPPAIESRELLNSFRIMTNNTNDGPTAELFTQDPKAKLLEYGTSRMLPRPFMRPTRAIAERRLPTIMQSAVRRALNV